MAPLQPMTSVILQRPLGLTVILLAGILASFSGGLLLALAPWWVPDPGTRLAELSASAGALVGVTFLCLGLWRHAGWTWWVLAVVTYTLGVLGLLFAASQSTWIERLRDGSMALLFLADMVWYFQYKPSVVGYYAAISAARANRENPSRRDAA